MDFAWIAQVPFRRGSNLAVASGLVWGGVLGIIHALNHMGESWQD
jgi:uncharacterized membrane protein (UPF0136 family)